MGVPYAAHVLCKQLLMREERRSHWDCGFTEQLEPLGVGILKRCLHEDPGGFDQRVPSPCCLQEDIKF